MVLDSGKKIIGMSRSMAEKLEKDPKNLNINIENITSHMYELNLALGIHHVRGNQS